VEKERAETGHKKGGGNVQSGKKRNKNGGAEHGEHVLETENKHFRNA